MKRIFFISILLGLGILFTFSQDSIVSIPDTAFLYALIDEGVDINGDSLISYYEAEAVTELDVSQRRPADMTGIDAFVNLDSLSCDPQELNKLILSNNTQLKYLHCDGTLYWGYYSHLEILDISNNPLLKVLDCSSNPYLQNLDVSNLDSLQYLNCISCILNSLDISNCGSLKYLYCGFNQLTSLDVSNQTALIELHCEGNQLINLDISGNTSLREINLESMENLEEVCVWETPFPPEEVELFTWRSPNIYYSTNCQMNIVSIPDTAFLHALIDEGVDSNGDGLISYDEAEAVTELDVSGENYSNRGNISDMSGIEAFINLDSLNCSLNELTSLDLTFNTVLTYLNCRSNRINSLDISKNVHLATLVCWSNELDSLDVSTNTALDSLDCSSNKLTSLDVSKNPVLTYLDLDYNQITNLDISNNNALTYLSCWFNQQLSSLDVSNNTALTYLNLYYNKITSLDVSNNTALESLICARNQLSSLDISNNTVLLELWCSINQLNSLDISNNTALTLLRCESNQLTSLDVSENVALTELSCSGNAIDSLDVSKNTALEELHCYDNQLSGLDISKNTALRCLWCNNNQLTSLDLSNNVALNRLWCSDNQLTSLDVSNNVALIDLNCRENSLSNLDVSENTSLTALDCSNNQLTGLDVTANVKLSGSYHPYGGFSPGLYCSDNQLTSLDISKNKDLYAFDCHNNQLNSLDISENVNLRLIDLSNMTSLGEVCVWESFAADSAADSGREMEIITEGSTGICFQTDCNGLCSEGIILLVSVDTIYQPMNLEATSSAGGMIFLVPVDTDTDIQMIRVVCLDSIDVEMNIPVMIPLEGLENGTYWLYATDTTDNISEPKAFTIMGVGIEKSDARSLRIYPNPASTLLTIEINTIDLINVTITSINGQLMLDRQLKGTSHQLDLSSFQKGVYLITIISSDFTITRKVIKL